MSDENISNVIPITFEGPLTESDKATLREFKNSEVFRLVRKLCAHHYALIGDRMTTVRDTEGLHHAQGQLLAVKNIYCLLLFNATHDPKQVEIGRKASKLPIS